MQRKSAVAALTVLALSVLASGIALAASNVTVTATVTSASVPSGSRSITLASATALNTGIAGGVKGVGSVEVTELNVLGAALDATNSWKLTTQIPSPIACTTAATCGTDTIASTALASAPSAGTLVNPNSLFGVTLVAGAGGTLNAERDFYMARGQSVATFYSGLYHGDGDITLTIPSGTKVGTYSGTMVVTLYQ